MILLIDNYDSFTHNLYQLLAMHTQQEIRVVRNDHLTLEAIEALNPQAIVLSPGPGTPQEAGICIPLIQRFAPKIPILGVCLGHQAIGEAFGAEVVRCPEKMHGKPSLVYHWDPEVFHKISSPFSAGRYHSLMVAKRSLPKELIPIAETQEGVLMAMRHETYPCFGVQFHPESILTPDGHLLIQSFLKVAQC